MLLFAAQIICLYAGFVFRYAEFVRRLRHNEYVAFGPLVSRRRVHPTPMRQNHQSKDQLSVSVGVVVDQLW